MTFPVEMAVVVNGARIPQARQNGALLQTTPLELSTLVAHEAVVRSGIDPTHFNSVHWGMMYQTEGNIVHLPKHAASGAGVPVDVPAMLCNRLCCSGLQAVIDGSRSIWLGESEVVLAGSIDSISRTSTFSLNPKRQLPVCSEEDPVTASTLDEKSGKRIAELMECFAQNCGIERATMDDFAFHSRERARRAQRSGVFSAEITPVPPALLRSGPQALTQDQIESRWPTRESLAQIASPYGPDGRVTRGNASTFADGSAAVVLSSSSFARKVGIRPLGVVRSWAITAAGDDQMGHALVSSMTRALEKGGVSVCEVDWFELEEAFAANCVYAAKMLSIPYEKINPCGGALALGHPPATSGLRQLLCTAYGLQKSGMKFALIGVPAGGSQAISILMERAD